MIIIDCFGSNGELCTRICLGLLAIRRSRHRLAAFRILLLSIAAFCRMKLEKEHRLPTTGRRSILGSWWRATPSRLRTTCLCRSGCSPSPRSAHWRWTGPPGSLLSCSHGLTLSTLRKRLCCWQMASSSNTHLLSSRSRRSASPLYGGPSSQKWPLRKCSPGTICLLSPVGLSTACSWRSRGWPSGLMNCSRLPPPLWLSNWTEKWGWEPVEDLFQSVFSKFPWEAFPQWP